MTIGQRRYLRILNEGILGVKDNGYGDVAFCTDSTFPCADPAEWGL